MKETDKKPRTAAENGETSDAKADIESLTYEKLADFVRELKEPAYRTSQIFGWLHVRHVNSFDEMTNLSLALRARLAQTCLFFPLSIRTVQASQKDGTKKYLFALSDGSLIESVLLNYHHGSCACISSQVGCRMGCAFCASGQNGLTRSLSAAEMLEQIYRIEQESGEGVKNVVVMGMGEPLDNYDALLDFLHILTDPRGRHLSCRSITVSTCGIVPKIRRLAKEQLPITLALSLHAADQDKRRSLMPVAAAYDIGETVEACRYFAQQTGRRVTMEYTLIDGFNDSDEDARRLAQLAKRADAHVNLIPVNPVSGHAFWPPTPKKVGTFKNNLEKSGINVTIRREMGRDIEGACGQLRKRYMSADAGFAVSGTSSGKKGTGR